MKYDINKIYKEDYNVKFLSFLRQSWKNNSSFSCLDSPKKTELFLLLDGCDAEYTLANGTKLFAKSGNLIYTPINGKYTVHFYNFTAPKSSTLGIAFLMSDQNGNPFSFQEDILILNTNEKIVSLFDSAERYSNSLNHNVQALFKSILYQIITEIGKNQYAFASRQEHGHSIVSRALRYVHNNLDENFSVTKLAELCNVSPTYLRQLFHKHTNKSPSQYILDVKLQKAKNYLSYGDLPIKEISEELGFSSTSYFIETFKRKYGISPLVYRKKNAK